MTSWGRAFLPVAAVVLVGLTVVGILHRPRPERALGEFDWGEPLQTSAGPAILNQVQVAALYDAERRRLAYYTGASSSGSAEPNVAPERIIAEAVHDDVTMRMRAFDSYSRERARDEAAEVARIVALATTRVWPAQPIPVQVDVHFMPDDAAFSLAKRVDWRAGDSYEVAVFANDKGFDAGTAVHELYHALAIRWSLGTKDPASRSQPNAAHIYEETAGDLFTLCGRLLADESLTRQKPFASVVIDSRRFVVPLNGEDLGAVLASLSSKVPFSKARSQVVRALLVTTITADVFGEQQTIALESPQANRLLARCRESAANPMLLGFRLAEIHERIAAQPERRTADD